MRVHSGEKPFVCSQRNYSCNQADRLRIYMRIHSREKIVMSKLLINCLFQLPYRSIVTTIIIITTTLIIITITIIFILNLIINIWQLHPAWAPGKSCLTLLGLATVQASPPWIWWFTICWFENLCSCMYTNPGCSKRSFSIWTFVRIPNSFSKLNRVQIQHYCLTLLTMIVYMRNTRQH